MTINIWPSGCACHALRDPGSKGTLPAPSLDGSVLCGGSRIVSHPAGEPFRRAFDGWLRAVSLLYYGLPLSRLQRGHIDDEAVFHVSLDRAVIGRVHVLDRDGLDVAGNVVLAAEIEHLLRLRQATDQ